MQIEQQTQRMHKHHPQQAIAQMPQITGPDPFDTTGALSPPTSSRLGAQT